MKLALHTWSLDSTPLAEVLRIARSVGWDAIELRRIDLLRFVRGGFSVDDFVGVVRASTVPVACVGVEAGWMFAEGDERHRLLDVFAEQCSIANALGSSLLMGAADETSGEISRAVESVREVGEIAASHGLRLAIEGHSRARQINTIQSVREILREAAHPNCGLLIDSYHLQRSGERMQALDDVSAHEIAHVQFSDVPVVASGAALPDRLPPGRGTVPFGAFFRWLSDKQYRGYCSYEAPNAAAWDRPAEDVAREALAATRAFL